MTAITDRIDNITRIPAHRLRAAHLRKDVKGTVCENRIAYG